MKQHTTGIILAGGSSRRMGQDKALLELGGRTLLYATVETVSRTCDEVIIAGGSQPVEGLPELSFRWVRDPPGAEGPLAGLAAGLAAASYSASIVVACDMPFLNERLLKYIVRILGDCDAAVPRAGGSSQPLHAAYSRECLLTVQALVRSGATSMSDLLSRLRVRYIPERRCLKLDPDGLSWFNMNTTDDFRNARFHWARRKNQVAAA
jgi:molybdopterin-guanine dinucleotide biosynthesis protein A